MPKLTLSDDDGATLRKAVESYLSDLRMEIADTDAHDVRESLKHEESILKRVVEQLR